MGMGRGTYRPKACPLGLDRGALGEGGGCLLGTGPLEAHGSLSGPECEGAHLHQDSALWPGWLGLALCAGLGRRCVHACVHACKGESAGGTE